ncbi:flagellar hook assembly protein FlgD [Sphingomonas rubra]|uniref:Basal-body rod modification protein FlgD n=1 Tax=Sphingomonas rubra TaxID=634430 RepID=A0A1I5UJL5_9SPHN|nr:flagellar hook assembly protein FlgD [Sphingomonas rubra]SFP95369.1 flagellar basal-body rod modification protein FlgD [Sphingomonas rubra]
MSVIDTTYATQPGIDAYSAKMASKVSSAGAKSSLDQSDFLKLMTAQLNNQDPFNPVDNTQMVAQMAQFSSVAGISEMNVTLKGLATKLGSTSATDAMGFVGKTVLTEGDTAYERASGGITGAVELDGEATDVNVTIADKNGNVVRSMQLGRQAQGAATYDWDGTDGAGNKLNAGPYTVTVDAANAGKTVTARGLVWAPVDSVSVPASGDATLNVTGIGTVKTSAIRSIA